MLAALRAASFSRAILQRGGGPLSLGSRHGGRTEDVSASTALTLDLIVGMNLGATGGGAFDADDASLVILGMGFGAGSGGGRDHLATDCNSLTAELRLLGCRFDASPVPVGMRACGAHPTLQLSTTTPSEVGL